MNAGPLNAAGAECVPFNESLLWSMQYVVNAERPRQTLEQRPERVEGSNEDTSFGITHGHGISRVCRYLEFNG
jgi:hypothetical protein